MCMFAVRVVGRSVLVNRLVMRMYLDVDMPLAGSGMERSGEKGDGAQ